MLRHIGGAVGDPLVDPCNSPEYGPEKIHVTIPLAGSGVTPDSVYARRIYAGEAAAEKLIVDLKIREASKGRSSLDDVMRTLYRTYAKEKSRGFTDAEFRQVCESAAGVPLAEIFDGYVHGKMSKRDFITRAGRYAAAGVTGAMILVLAGMVAAKAGGSNMFGGGGPLQIGQANSEAVAMAMQAAGIRVAGHDTGGLQGRRVEFDFTSGVMTVQCAGQPPRTI